MLAIAPCCNLLFIILAGLWSVPEEHESLFDLLTFVQKHMKRQPTAEECYLNGLKYAKRSEWGEAATCFKHAIALDSQTPAVESLAMIERIQEYYHKDNFNP